MKTHEGLIMKQEVEPPEPTADLTEEDHLAQLVRIARSEFEWSRSLSNAGDTIGEKDDRGWTHAIKTVLMIDRGRR